jgi:Zn ribbon nucleic-acid-binding protein
MIGTIKCPRCGWEGGVDDTVHRWSEDEPHLYECPKGQRPLADQLEDTYADPE